MLASIGLFGVVAYVVTQRTQEIGIRVALGAPPASVIRLMTTIGTRLFATGIGLLTALAVGHVLASVVFGLSPRDPVSLVSQSMRSEFVGSTRAARTDGASAASAAAPARMTAINK